MPQKAPPEILPSPERIAEHFLSSMWVDWLFSYCHEITDEKKCRPNWATRHD